MFFITNIYQILALLNHLVLEYQGTVLFKANKVLQINFQSVKLFYKDTLHCINKSDSFGDGGRNLILENAV